MPGEEEAREVNLQNVRHMGREGGRGGLYSQRR